MAVGIGKYLRSKTRGTGGPTYAVDDTENTRPKRYLVRPVTVRYDSGLTNMTGQTTGQSWNIALNKTAGGRRAR